MYFVYLPSWARYGKVAIPEIKHRGAVLSIVNSLQIPIIDIGQVFDRHEDPFLFFRSVNLDITTKWVINSSQKNYSKISVWASPPLKHGRKTSAE